LVAVEPLERVATIAVALGHLVAVLGDQAISLVGSE
jgi:hypothetical protein